MTMLVMMLMVRRAAGHQVQTSPAVVVVARRHLPLQWKGCAKHRQATAMWPSLSAQRANTCPPTLRRGRKYRRLFRTSVFPSRTQSRRRSPRCGAVLRLCSSSSSNSSNSSNSSSSSSSSSKKEMIMNKHWGMRGSKLLSTTPIL